MRTSLRCLIPFVDGETCVSVAAVCKLLFLHLERPAAELRIRVRAIARRHAVGPRRCAAVRGFLAAAIRGAAASGGEPGPRLRARLEDPEVPPGALLRHKLRESRAHCDGLGTTHDRQPDAVVAQLL